MKVKGHTTIILTDKDGNEERFEDDNMETNAIEKLLANCGWMNRDNLDQTNLVEDLLGGILALDTALTEDAEIVHVPAGVKMTANGSILNTSISAEVSELGQYSAQESGWSQDGSTYTMTFDYGTSQGNGTIACVCLTGKNYGLAGEGNSTSNARHATRANITNLAGTPTTISGIPGYVFNIDLVDSSCMSFSIEEVEGATKGYLRKYRLPISKVNLKGTPTAPVILSEQEVTLDGVIDSASRLLAQSLGSNLVIWNGGVASFYGSLPVWGDGFTQYVWTLTPAGVLTKETLLNTSGETLYGIGGAIFDGNYIYFPQITQRYSQSYGYWNVDTATTRIYILNRTTGAITGIDTEGSSYYHGVAHETSWTFRTNLPWYLLHGTGDGRIVTTGNHPAVIDAPLGAIYPTNASTSSVGNVSLVSGLIRHSGLTLYREQGYIASINNLSQPVTKEADKAMKIIYRLTFEEQEEE